MTPHRPTPPRRVVMIVFPDAQILDVTGPLEVFAQASRAVAESATAGRAATGYSVEIVAREAGGICTSSGIQIVADRAFRDVRGPVDTLIVAGGRGTVAALADRALIRTIQRVAPRARRTASVCSGAFLLAEAGILDGRRAVTHWNACDLLAERYPRVTVMRDPIFVRDGNVWSSAGVCAGMDLALALVEEDHGQALALTVARWLVVFLKRPGGQAQFSEELRAQSVEHDTLREVQVYAQRNLAADLRVGALARRAAMSPRNFARVFLREIGETPARWVERARIEGARRALEVSAEGVDAIAGRCGFPSAEIMRRAFLRRLRVSPSAYRARFRSTAA
jgi:transcriptional regulator GlxA family with amidase domain